MATTANGTVLIAKETATTSAYTYYKLTLGSITRKGANITITLNITFYLSSSTGAGSDWNRTMYVHNGGGTVIASKVIKDGEKWESNHSYSKSMTFTYNAGTNGNVTLSKWYITINGSTGTSCLWNHEDTKSGGSVGNTFTLVIDASNIVHVYVNGAWKDATPYVRVGNAWKEATAYVRVGNAWKECF